MQDSKKVDDSKDKTLTEGSDKGETTPWERKDKPTLHEKHDTAVKYDKDQIEGGTVLPRKT